MQTANDILRDKTIAHEILLNRYYSNTTKKVMELLREVEKDLEKTIKLNIENWTGTATSIKRLDSQLESVKTIISEGYDLMGRDLLQEMKDAAIYEQEWQHKTITSAVPIELNLTMAAPVTLFAAIEDTPFQGKLLKEWIDKLDQESFNSIQSAVRMGLVEGQSYSDITRRIIGTKALQYSDGVMHLNRTKTQALVSTAVAHSTNAARDEFYKANDDLVKSVQFVATLDMRTTPICRSKDGRVYPLDAYPRPPLHFRCRSVVTAVLKSWKELGLKEPTGLTRASMDGQVAESETYQSWLAKKDAAFQDEVLGKARGEMFRNGTTLDRFVDGSGKTLTLEQLKKIEK
jgi:SPP1 gp7 family putative phage head morphogenesis protein